MLINPKGLRRPGGYATFICDGPTRQMDTFTCAHCMRLISVPPGKSWTEVSGGCVRCMDYANPTRNLICLACVKKGGCQTNEEWLDAYERQAERGKGVAGFAVAAPAPRVIVPNPPQPTAKLIVGPDFSAG